MRRVDTLRALIDEPFSLSVHCNTIGCRHSGKLDLQALAEKLGPDFVAVGSPNPLVAKLKCGLCGGKDLVLILSPETGYSHGIVSVGPDYARVNKSEIAVNSRRSRRRPKLV